MRSWLLLKREQDDCGEGVAIKGLEAASNLPESDVDRLVVAKAVFNGDSSGDAAKSIARGGAVALRLLARQYRNVWAAAPLKKLSVETLTPLSGSYDGDSADLLYALATFLSLAQESDLIQALPRDFAATGTLDSDGVVGPVKAVVLKIEAAIQTLPRGSIVFYPCHKPERETRWVDEALIVRARDRGIELQAVEFIEEALAALGIGVLWRRRDQPPYRALGTYQVEHSYIFFGRDDQVTEFLERLQQAAEAKRPGGLVEAASGAGKSSFVQAGLLARLRILPRKAHTPVEYAVWQPRLAGASQAQEIDEAILAKSVLLNWRTHAGVNSTGFSGLNDLDEIQTLEDLGARLGKTALDDRLLVWVVDQFEELFTQKYSDAARVAFARFLAQLQVLGVWVIATLRTESKSRFMALADAQGKPLLVDVFKNLMFPLARMPVEALGQMITEPARVAGVSFEARADGVRLDALLRQDALGADSMPLVGYALNELWLKKKLPDKPDQLGRKTPQLTFEAYKVICGGEERGGIRRVLGIEAERAFEKLPQGARDELPRLLDVLAVPVDGEEREAARPAELAQWEEGTPGWHLIEALREKRLLITEPATETSPAQVRVVHEALFEGWDRAREELEKSRDTRMQIKRLVARHDEWAKHGEPPSPAPKSSGSNSAANKELTLRQVHWAIAFGKPGVVPPLQAFRVPICRRDTSRVEAGAIQTLGPHRQRQRWCGLGRFRHGGTVQAREVGGGLASFRHLYAGAIWLCKDAANRDQFVQDPQRYVAELGGHCVGRVAPGDKTAGLAEYPVRYQGRLYLACSAGMLADVQKDVASSIGAATERWIRLADEPSQAAKLTPLGRKLLEPEPPVPASRESRSWAREVRPSSRLSLVTWKRPFMIVGKWPGPEIPRRTGKLPFYAIRSRSEAGRLARRRAPINAAESMSCLASSPLPK